MSPAATDEGRGAILSSEREMGERRKWERGDWELLRTVTASCSRRARSPARHRKPLHFHHSVSEALVSCNLEGLEEDDESGSNVRRNGLLVTVLWVVLWVWIMAQCL